jgi:predicted nucleic acid-binding protein
MKFWDTSAIVPLLVAQCHSQTLQSILAEDPRMLVWWTTETECASALARLERGGSPTAGLSDAFGRLKQFATIWQEIDPTDEVRETAIRFLRVHPLRAADALQLGAAFVAAGRRPASLDMMVLDERLAAAAQKEGFSVIEIAA